MSEKTEPPSPKRLRDAREKGQVAKSQEIGSAATVIAVFIYFIVGWDFVWMHTQALFNIPFVLMNSDNQTNYADGIKLALSHGFALTIPPIVLSAFAGILANLIQVGVLIAIKGALPKLENISPANWFKKTFSIKNLVELLKNVTKIVVIFFVIRIVLESYIPSLMKVLDIGILPSFELLKDILFDFVIYCSPIFILIAVLDYFFQHYQHIKGLKMSKDEQKQEYKEMEGDPEIKSKRKELHREMAMSSKLEQVRKSSVLVTNPTHYAVAILYDDQQTPLPIVTAKGEGLLARRMMEIAKQEGIPIMQNVPLARSLYAEADEMQYIPKDYIAPIAEVLKWVKSLG